MREIFKPLAVEVRGNELHVNFHSDLKSDDRLYAKFQLLFALLDGVTHMVTSNDILIVTLANNILVREDPINPSSELVVPIRFSSIERLTEDLSGAADFRPIIVPSKTLAFGVEVGFRNSLGCLPVYLDEELAGIGVEVVVISSQPAYNRCVLELYIPQHVGMPWEEIEAQLREIFSFDDE